MLKLFSSEPSRVQESWHTLVVKISNLSFATFQRNMQPHIDEVTKMDGNCSSNETYQFFLTKIMYTTIILHSVRYLTCIRSMHV